MGSTRVITGEDRIVTRSWRGVRMRGGFPFVRVARPSDEQERKNRDEERRGMRGRGRYSSRRNSPIFATFIIRVFPRQSLLRSQLVGDLQERAPQISLRRILEIRKMLSTSFSGSSDNFTV